MDIHHNQVLTSSQTEPERNPTLSPLLSSLQLPPNLRVSAVAPRTIQLGAVRTGGVEIVLTGFTVMGQLGFKGI